MLRLLKNNSDDTSRFPNNLFSKGRRLNVTAHVSNIHKTMADPHVRSAIFFYFSGSFFVFITR
jgi:hypothetical protein